MRVEWLREHLHRDGLNVLVINHEFAAILLARQVCHDISDEVKRLVLGKVAEHAEDGLGNDECKFTLAISLDAQQVLLAFFLTSHVRKEHERMFDSLLLHHLIARQ